MQYVPVCSIENGGFNSSVMSQTGNLITLKAFMFTADAYPLMSKLESEGIECYLEGENTVAVDPFLSNAIGGVRVKIMDRDSKRAFEIMKASEQTFKEKMIVENKKYEAFSKGYVEVDTYCPECESIHIYRKKFPTWKTVLAILFFWIYLPLAFLTKTHYCADCGHVWKQ
jgi:hypothetical protein